MNQSRLESIIEQWVNVGSGFLVSLFVWQFIVAPWKGYTVTMQDNLDITTLFTLVSVTRGYVWRRFFNADLHRVVHRFVRRVSS